MARLPRLSGAGLVHLVSMRGNDRQSMFRDDSDHAQFLAWLREACIQRGIAVHAFALVADRVLLLATPSLAHAMAGAIQALGRRYVQWFNARHGRSGTLWEGRYRSALVDGAAQLLACMQFVESEPVRMGRAGEAASWPWSSFAHHAGLRADAWISDLPAFWNLGNTPYERQSAYRRLFDEPQPGAQREAIETALVRGRPLGGPGFEAELASRGLAVPPVRRRGRPRKPVGEAAASARAPRDRDPRS